MLALGEFRRLLGADAAQLSDTEIEQLMREMYAFAEIAMSIHEDGRRVRREAMRLLPPHVAEAVEERSAIMEFDGGADRDHADRVAILDTARV